MADMKSLNREITARSAKINSALTRYASLVAHAAACEKNQEPIPPETLSQAASVEYDIEDSIRQNETGINALMSLKEKRAEPLTLAEDQQLERHIRSIRNSQLELRRSQSELEQLQQRIQLFSSVQQEINAFKTPATSRSDALLMQERDHIDSSNRLTDDILAQAYETRLEFSRQGSLLRNANTRINSVVAQIPGVNSVMRMIHMRRQRDAALLGSLAGVCTLALLWVLFG